MAPTPSRPLPPLIAGSASGRVHKRIAATNGISAVLHKIPEEKTGLEPWFDQGQVHKPADPECPELVGTWLYGTSSSYHISRTLCGQLCLNEKFSSGHIVSAQLQPEGRWFKGVIMSSRGKRLGTIRLRYVEEQGTIVSNFKTSVNATWGDNIFAEKASVTDEGILTRKPASGALPEAMLTRPKINPCFHANLSDVQQMKSTSVAKVFQSDASQVANKWKHNFAQDPAYGKQILHEIMVLSAIQHENVLMLLGLLLVRPPNFDNLYITMAYMAADMHYVMSRGINLFDTHSHASVCQILNGVRRDLIPSTAFMNNFWAMRIACYGLPYGRTLKIQKLGFHFNQECSDNPLWPW